MTRRMEKKDETDDAYGGDFSVRKEGKERGWSDFDEGGEGEKWKERRARETMLSKNIIGKLFGD